MEWLADLLVVFTVDLMLPWVWVLEAVLVDVLLERVKLYPGGVDDLLLLVELSLVMLEVRVFDAVFVDDALDRE